MSNDVRSDNVFMKRVCFAGYKALEGARTRYGWPSLFAMKGDVSYPDGGSYCLRTRCMYDEHRGNAIQDRLSS